MRIVVYLSYAFALTEIVLLVVKHSKGGNVKTRKDRGSLILLWVMIMIGFTGGFILSKFESRISVNYFYIWVGFVIILIGLIVRWVSIIQLGKSFTVDVAITDVARLKTDGLYKRVRHPSYSGLLLVILGFSVTMNSLLSIIAAVLPIFIAVVYRIHIEETLMLEEFGAKYKDYCKTTKKILPYIY
jgi:protein-S-isoprenylcysteine O-methyltransferase Ste14